ncbi:hypothetical protein N2152v2_008850 [Parachlorella kessleri]
MSAEEEASPGTSVDTGAKLFLGGLSWDTTEAVVMRDRTTSRPRGFGFVTFKDKEVADRVVQEIHIIDGRQIDAKKSVPQEQKPKARKIFVGGLAPDTTEVEFRAYFEQYGPVSDAQIMQDHMTGRSRGFGFVTFEEDAAVERVFAAGSMQELGGKRVEIKHATPKGAGSQASSSSVTSGSRLGGVTGGAAAVVLGPGSSPAAAGRGYGRAAAPLPYAQVPGSPYGFGMFPYGPGVMPPHASPYSMGYPSPYVMMQQMSGYPGAAAAFPYPAPGSYGGSPGRGPVQPGQQQHAPSTPGSSSGSGYARQQQHHYYEQQPGGQGVRPHSQLPYPRPLAGNGRGKGKVDSASELSEHGPSRYLKG